MSDESANVVTTTNASDVTAYPADHVIPEDEDSWNKQAFGRASVIFAVLPPPVILIGALVNLSVALGLAARRACLHQHPVNFYAWALCFYHVVLLVVDSGVQEWGSYITGGHVAGRAGWLCRGLPYAVAWVRTSACWVTACALVDRMLTLVRGTVASRRASDASRRASVKSPALPADNALQDQNPLAEVKYRTVRHSVLLAV